MAFLNLMENKLKPKEVNDALSAVDTSIYDINEEIKNIKNSIASIDDASEITYDNTTSGLSATNVQSAIDEVDSAVNLRVLVDDTYITSAHIQGYDNSNRISITCNFPTQGNFTKIDFYDDHIRVRTKNGETETDKSVSLTNTQ